MANTKIQSEQIADSAIVTDRIAADAVTTAKIADNVALGGSPTTTTQSASDNSTKIATTEYVTTAISSLIDSAPSTLNTLNEIAAALNDDANFNTTVTNSIADKLPLGGGTLTGNLTLQYTYPRINFVDTNHDSDYSIINNDGSFSIYDITNNSHRLQISSAGAATFAGTISSGAITSTGLLTLTGASILLNESANNEQSVRVQNSTVTAYFGVEGSSANRFSGSAANNMFLGTTTADGIQLATNNTVRATINSSGDTIFNGDLRAATLQAHVGTDQGTQLTAFADSNGNTFLAGYKLTINTGANNNRTASLHIDNDHNVGVVGALTVGAVDEISGTTMYVKKDSAGNVNLQRWGEGTNGNSQSSYRFRIDQNFQFIANSGSGDNFLVDSADGHVSIGHGNAPSHEIDIRSSSHGIISILAGTNSSASLRLKNDNVDWDVNCQTNDSFALYQHSYAGSSTGLQPITVLPNGNVGINKSVPDEKLTVNVATASASKDSLSVQNTGVSSAGHAVGMRFQYNTAVPAAIRTHLTDTSSGAGHLSLLTTVDGTANNLVSRVKVHPAGHVSINSTQTGTEKTGGLVLVGPIVTQGRFGNGQIGRNQSNGADFTSVSANWATHSSSGVTGSYSGAVKFTVPSAAGSAGQGYGSFCGIIQVSGYNGPAMTASFHGYQNQALYGATSSILSNNGSFSISLGINGSHGWYIEVDVPGITHPNAYIQLSHGGTSNSASIWDLNECVWTWS